MIFIEFPITNSLRFPLLFMEWTFAFICFELGLIFVIKYSKQEKGMKYLQELGYASLLFGYSLMTYFYIISDYYASSEIVSPFLIWRSGSYRALFLNMGYFSIILGAFFFIFLMERYKTYLIRKYFFSYCFLTLIIFFSVILFFDIDVTQDLVSIFWPLFFLFLILFITDFVKIQKTEKRFVVILKYLVLFTSLAVGFTLTTDLMIGFFGLGIRLVGSIIQLISIIMLFLFLISIPSFAELDWQDKVESIYLIDHSGVCLFHQPLAGIDFFDEQLVSSALQGINIILRELISVGKGEGISVIKKKGKSIIIYPGQMLNGVLICKEDLKLARFHLTEFVQRVENLYHNVLKEWDGAHTDILKPVENLVRQIFSK